ncbi:MAG: hypothetical protein NC924_04795, partial [Candidatus Omnitrophica bacterium]|nr:hypothetical protein [Candidatus Omnitrophota bacterium]
MKTFFFGIMFYSGLWLSPSVSFAIVDAANPPQTEEFAREQSYCSVPWNTAINQAEEPKEKYPTKRKITPETLRQTLKEYYIPQVS